MKDPKPESTRCSVLTSCFMSQPGLALLESQISEVGVSGRVQRLAVISSFPPCSHHHLSFLFLTLLPGKGRVLVPFPEVVSPRFARGWSVPDYGAEREIPSGIAGCSPGRTIPLLQREELRLLVPWFNPVFVPACFSQQQNLIHWLFSRSEGVCVCFSCCVTWCSR